MIPTIHRRNRSSPRAAWAALACFAVLLSACRSQPKSAPTAAGAQTAATAPTRVVKIITHAEGMTAVTRSGLAGAGIDLEAGALKLLNRGAAVPFWIGGQGKSASLRFYARPSASLYTLENVYWLIQAPEGNHELDWLEGPLGDATGSAAEVGDSPAAEPFAAPVSNAYIARLRLEQNLLYNPQVEAGDHWLWASLPAPANLPATVSVKGAPAGEGRIRARVWASTEAQVSPDHHLVVRLNGQEVVNESWDGKGAHTLSGLIPAGLLHRGDNEVEILAPGDTGVPADVTALDWLEIETLSLPEPEGDRLEMAGLAGTVELHGFSGTVNVYDVTDPAAPALAAAELPAQGSSFTGQAGRRYWAAGPGGYLQPDRLEAPVLEPNLRAVSEGANYLAVGPADLLEPLSPLLDLRRQEGYQVEAIPLQAVYDQFLYGIPEPQAVRRLLQLAREAWKTQPEFLLLVGDASYDPRGYLPSSQADRLPAFFVDTLYGGQTASDAGYAQIDGDAWPPDQPAELTPLDLAVGRFPAQTPAQVQTLVEKTLAYEKASPEEAWQRSILAIADGQDPTFSADAKAFLKLFAGRRETELLSPPAGEQGVQAAIQERINRGDLLVAYFGHGSVNMWGKDRLFTSEDVAGLENGTRLPVVLEMTCLAGLFTHPKAESIAEAWLWKKDGGAVAVLGPTSLTVSSDQALLSLPLAQGYLDALEPRLGKLLLDARNQVPGQSPGQRDVLRTFLLFGDPALSLH